MEAYSRHMIVCTGRFCSPEGGGRSVYARLAQLLDREDLLFGPERVKRSEAPCLGVCAGGPIAVVYPEGLWYSCVDEKLLERIVCEHLRDGRPIEDRVFHRLSQFTPNDVSSEGPVGGT
jgi:(2Fe-2S) ferredoxin